MLIDVCPSKAGGDHSCPAKIGCYAEEDVARFNLCSSGFRTIWRIDPRNILQDELVVSDVLNAKE